MSSATIAAAAPALDHDECTLIEQRKRAAPHIIPSLDPRIISGALGSVVSGVVTTPFEVAKVKQQNYSLYRNKLPTSVAAAFQQQRRPTAVRSGGVFSTIRHVVATEGIQGAYAGLAPTVIMSVPNFVLFLISTDELVSYLRGRQAAQAHNNNSVWSLSDDAIPFVGGAIARLIASTAVAPLEMLRTRAASLTNNKNATAVTNPNNNSRQPSALSQVWNDLGTILRKDGVGAVYKGLVPTLWRDVPFAAIYMLCLERFRQISRPILLKEDDLSTWSSPHQRQAGFEFTNAALAGMVAASCTAPLDVVKTRLQSAAPSPSPSQQGQGQHCGKAAASSQSTVQVLRTIVRNEGLVGLWRGNQARMMKVAPQYAIMISFYEVGKKILTS